MSVKVYERPSLGWASTGEVTAPGVADNRR